MTAGTFNSCATNRLRRKALCWLVLFLGWFQGHNFCLFAADAGPGRTYEVKGYLVDDGRNLLSSTNLTPFLSPHTGPSIGLDEIVRTASELQVDYGSHGYPGVGIAIGEREITNGIVVMHVFRGSIPQIVISGRRYLISSNGVVAAATSHPTSAANTASNATAVAVPEKRPAGLPAAGELTPAEIALHQKIAELNNEDRAAGLPLQPPPTSQLILASKRPLAAASATNTEEALRLRLAELARQDRRRQLLPASNPTASANGPAFEVKGYEVIGNTLLSKELMELVLQPYIVTNATFETLRRALTELQTVYRDRGYVTVSVRLPAQKLDTNAIVKIRVFEGHLSDIVIVNNLYHSQENILRSLPSLQTNSILNSAVFQAELDRANANQDRQIYPQIEPGPDENTTLLRLNVKDRLPLHAKLELNNQNSPGTPDLRANGSLVYNNLWQMEHSAGVQYSMSPESYKAGDQWNFYDQPLVANYSAFYRLPLGTPESIEKAVEFNPGSFGYDEATRRFNLPAPSGRPELNIYASRSTIDTGIATLLNETISNNPTNSLTRHDVQQDITINEDIGMRLSLPLKPTATFQSGFSFGLDFKHYNLASHKTNIFTLKNIETDTTGGTVQYITNISYDVSSVPATVRDLSYLPLQLRYDANWHGPAGNIVLGTGITRNLWFSGTIAQLQNVTGSTRSSGGWVAINPSLSGDIFIHTNWTLSFRLDGQVATEPLISNEQFGAGGMASVRGYHEGEVFGDQGWHGSIELKTPPHVVGVIQSGDALTIRGSAFMDYAQTVLIDPQGRSGTMSLWGVGFGGVATLGSHWEARFIFGLPLIATTTTPAGEPRFNFSLTSQF